MKNILSIFSAVLICGTLFCACTPSQPVASSPTFDDIVASRRSIRKYDPSVKPTRDEVLTIIATSQEAPSWANVQPARYYVVMSEDKLSAVKGLIGPGNARNVADAPVLIVTTYVKGMSGFFGGNPTNEIGEGWGAYDTGLAHAYLILKAREMGYDTLIMGMRDSEKLRALLDIPQTEEVMAVISVGKRVSDPERPSRKAIDEIVVFK